MTRQLTDTERARIQSMRENALATSDAERAADCKRALAGYEVPFHRLVPPDPPPASTAPSSLGDSLAPVPGPLAMKLDELFHRQDELWKAQDELRSAVRTIDEQLTLVAERLSRFELASGFDGDDETVNDPGAADRDN